MKKKLNQSTKGEMLNRLNNLTETSERKWGKMTASEMLWHCNQVLGLPLGIVKLKPNKFVKLLFGKLIKKQVISNKHYKHDLPTAPEYRIKKTYDFETEKNNLIKNINDFINKPDEELNKTTHEIFGKMNADEWRISQWKHLDHHFYQFGI